MSSANEYAIAKRMRDPEWTCPHKILLVNPLVKTIKQVLRDLMVIFTLILMGLMLFLLTTPRSIPPPPPSIRIKMQYLHLWYFGNGHCINHKFEFVAHYFDSEGKPPTTVVYTVEDGAKKINLKNPEETPSDITIPRVGGVERKFYEIFLTKGGRVVTSEDALCSYGDICAGKWRVNGMFIFRVRAYGFMIPGTSDLIMARGISRLTSIAQRLDSKDVRRSGIWRYEYERKNGYLQNWTHIRVGQEQTAIVHEYGPSLMVWASPDMTRLLCGGEEDDNYTGREHRRFIKFRNKYPLGNHQTTDGDTRNLPQIRHDVHMTIGTVRVHRENGDLADANEYVGNKPDWKFNDQQRCPYLTPEEAKNAKDYYSIDDMWVVGASWGDPMDSSINNKGDFKMANVLVAYTTRDHLYSFWVRCTQDAKRCILKFKYNWYTNTSTPMYSDVHGPGIPGGNGFVTILPAGKNMTWGPKVHFIPDMQENLLPNITYPLYMFAISAYKIIEWDQQEGGSHWVWFLGTPHRYPRHRNFYKVYDDIKDPDRYVCLNCPRRYFRKWPSCTYVDVFTQKRSGHFFFNCMGRSPPRVYVVDKKTNKKMNTLVPYHTSRTAWFRLKMPNIEFFDIKLPGTGIMAHVRLTRPYYIHQMVEMEVPLIIFKYHGHPGHQDVNNVYQFKYAEYLSGGLNWCTARIDVGGSGGEGYMRTNMHYKRIHVEEGKQILYVIQRLAELPYIDKTRIAMVGYNWGANILLFTHAFDNDKLIKHTIVVNPSLDLMNDMPFMTDRYMGQPTQLDNYGNYEDCSIRYHGNDLLRKKIDIITSDDHVNFWGNMLTREYWQDNLDWSTYFYRFRLMILYGHRSPLANWSIRRKLHDHIIIVFNQSFNRPSTSDTLEDFNEWEKKYEEEFIFLTGAKRVEDFPHKRNMALEHFACTV